MSLRRNSFTNDTTYNYAETIGNTLRISILITWEVKLKVVVIDDETDHREMIRETLERDGYEVVEADNGISGLAAILREKPDLIVCDVNMPEMTGDELLEKLRAFGNTGSSTIPFIFLSGHIGADGVIERLTAGANHCLQKPIDLDLLSAYVKSQLAATKRLSGYLKGRLDKIAVSVAESVHYEFDAYQSLIPNVNGYIDSIVGLIRGVQGAPLNSSMLARTTLDLNTAPGLMSGRQADRALNRIDYIHFFLADYDTRKRLANTANGEDLSWFLIFLVAKSHMKGLKLPVSDLYVSALSAKSTINARINALIEDGVFYKSSDENDGRRQLVCLTDSFCTLLMSHIDASIGLMNETVLYQGQADNS